MSDHDKCYEEKLNDIRDTYLGGSEGDTTLQERPL